jgi:V/A-type H+-transporting ATPase subunit C
MAREEIRPRGSGYGVDDYGYINARVRGMSTALLSKAELERMLKAENLEALALLLSNTDYGPDIKASEQKFVKGMRRLEVIEDGLNQNLIRTVAKICSFSEGKPAELLNIILSRWDVSNLKTIIRGKHAGMEPAQIIQQLFFVGNLERNYLEKLAHKEDVREVIDSLTDFYPQTALSLREQFNNYLASKNLVDLELALEKWYYRQALKLCDRMGKDFSLVRQFLRAEIDIINAMTCIKLTQVDVEPDDVLRFYIPGGAKIKEQDFSALIAMGGIDDILSWLERLPTVRDGLPERMELFRKQDDVSVFERLFEANLLRKVRGITASNPLGFNILISYLKRKYNELVNLRIILRTVEFGLSTEIVKQELIFV